MAFSRASSVTSSSPPKIAPVIMLPTIPGIVAMVLLNPYKFKTREREGMGWENMLASLLENVEYQAKILLPPMEPPKFLI